MLSDDQTPNSLINRPIFRRVIIIGAGTAGLSAAYQLKKSGFKSVMILEGQDRVGGRILTNYLDDGFSKPLDMGACWIHGLENNPVYELVQREKFPSHTGTILTFDIGTCVDENGNEIPNSLHTEVDQFFESLAQDIRDLFELDSINNNQTSLIDKRQINESFQKVFSEKFQNFLNLNGGDSETRRLKSKLLQRRFDQETGECGCNSMDQVSHYEFGSYRRPKGPDLEFPCGYSSLIRYLRSLIPESWLRFDKFVENISWYNDDQRIKIECANGERYECNHCIVTIPLACLKWNYKSLFTPALPAWKTEAIHKLDMGTVDKIYLFYDNLDFIKGDSLAIVYDKDDNIDIKKEWYKKIFLFMKVYDNVLLGWITGDEAIYCEDLDETYIGNVLTNVFRKSLKNPSIPKPNKVIRTQWFSNPCSRGSYSYVPVGATSRQHIKDLSRPLSVNNVPKLLFAGEATHTNYYSTVHGAYITGQQQAENLIKFIKNDSRLIKTAKDMLKKVNYDVSEPP
ncbi:unnamed protein product [Didymodactylos carnosus]|uniref:Amine oxidase domain-containing protein n=1 Tax=Didymodactylos carnosus TaxID=1234261 RepID=A0A813RLU4_9BILA|nr:unnamed protein product [Didymodactylos carnosus]CAF1117871.1 unnamed protein product [Didymodactylos carnosus]CAF3569849.1 unnamed protein product [Didymodactylos carnosus]CAF3889435.1 unnamed protein product [Didymodactylos carnosus]